MNKCAVVDCLNEGQPHTCPYDGGNHHHGRIHYSTHERWIPSTQLKFRQDDLYLICDNHYKQILDEINKSEIFVIETKSDGDYRKHGPFSSRHHATDWIEKQERDLEEEGINLSDWYQNNSFEITC